MEAVVLVSLGALAMLITFLISCVRCHRKLTSEEIQQREFEKFRKRYVRCNDQMLSKRIDYVRRVSDDRLSSVATGTSGHSYEDMATSSQPHAAVKQALKPSPTHSSEHSFFDDSFETVIEASGTSLASNCGGTISQGISAGLSVDGLTFDKQASYLSLQANMLLFVTEASGSLGLDVQQPGETNEGFSHSSDSTSSTSDNSDTLNSSYIVPKRGPKIRIIQPTVCRKPGNVKPDVGLQVPALNLDTPTGVLQTQDRLDVPQSDLTSQTDHSDSTIQLPVRAKKRNSVKMKAQNSLSSLKDFLIGGIQKLTEGKSNAGENQHKNDASSQCDEESLDDKEKLDLRNQRKLELEGPVFDERCLQGPRRFHQTLTKELTISQKGLTEELLRERRFSGDVVDYQNLRPSRFEDCPYSELSKRVLVLPRRPQFCSPLGRLGGAEDGMRTSKSEPVGRVSTQSDHTYESISSETMGNFYRGDMAEGGGETKKVADLSRQKILDTPAFRGSYTDSDATRNSLSLSPHHTYETIKSVPDSAKGDPLKSCECDNSAVIIGRRVSNPFSQKRIPKRTVNKKKQQPLNGRSSSKSKKSPTESENRYSPFPGSKKLAFKSAFKQTQSPKFSMMPALVGNISAQYLNNPAFCLDNLNIKTPEIKVENSSQCFEDKAFVSPAVLNHSMKSEVMMDREKTSGIDDRYQTLKKCIDLKVDSLNLQTSVLVKPVQYTKKSLPSLPDYFEREIIRHCQGNQFCNSTPFEQPPGSSLIQI